MTVPAAVLELLSADETNDAGSKLDTPAARKIPSLTKGMTEWKGTAEAWGISTKPTVLIELERASLNETEQKAARRLGVGAFDVACASYSHFKGKSLTERRDDLLVAERLAGRELPASGLRVLRRPRHAPACR